MLCSHRANDRGIVRWDRSSHAQSRLHQPGCASPCTSRARRRAAGTSARSPCAKSPDSAARRALHYAGIHAAESSASFCAQNVRIRDRQIVTGDREVEIVLQSQLDCIFE